MSNLSKMFGAEMADMLREAVYDQAEKIAEYDHRSGSQAMLEFSLTRKDLAEISPTYLTGRSKPVYLIKSIKEYKNKNTKFK